MVLFRMRYNVGIDAPNKLSVEEMIDKQIDDMIDEIEINGGFYR